MADSDDDRPLSLPPPAKRRKFAFKKLAKRLAEVDVEAYKDLKPIRAAPLGDAASFFEEALQSWRELNTGEHFIRAAAELHPKILSLPLLLHHKNEILEILLGAVSMKAIHSLEAILGLLGALARDLQAEFLPYIPNVFARLADLIDEGADVEPELLQHIFKCLATVCQHLVRLLVSELPSILKASSRLRHHKSPHVRRLAAAALAFLYRHTTHLQLKLGVRTIFAEHAVRPSNARADATALLLAEAAKGVANGLHSKAPRLLSIALQPDLLKAEDLKSSKSAPSTEELHARHHAVTERMLEHVLEYGRRGKLQPLWEAVWEFADQHLADVQQQTEGLEQAARSVSLVATMVEFHRGSRVEDFAPVLDLAKKLCSKTALTAALQQQHSNADAASLLLQQTVRLLTAIIASHSKQIGASGGFAVVQQDGPKWHLLFEMVPASRLLPFLRILLQPQINSGAVASVFAHYAMQTISKDLVQAAVPASTKRMLLPVLADFCKAASVRKSNKEMPLLESLPSGKEAVAYILHCLKAEGLKTAQGSSASETCCEILSALDCLQFSCRTPQEVVGACDAVMQNVNVAIKDAATDQGAVDPWLAVMGATITIKASCLSKLGEESLDVPALLGSALDLLRRFPANYCTVKATAAALAAAKQAGAQFDKEMPEDLLALLEANLRSRSQGMRRESLQVLAAFQQPSISIEAEAVPCQMLVQLLQIESMPVTLEAGRAASTILENIRAAFEFGQIPQILVAPATSAFLGLLNIRLSLFWSPASAALATVLQYHAEVAWPSVYAAIRANQEDFLRGDGGGILPGEDDAVELQSHDPLQRALYSGSTLAEGGATDASVRLTNTLKALSQAPNDVLQSHSKDWVPLFLTYTVATSGESDADIDNLKVDAATAHADAPTTSRQQPLQPTLISRVGKRAWRAHLKEWLAVIAAVKSPKGLIDSMQIRTAISLQLLDHDPSVQEAALKCMKGWKLLYLNDHLERLLRLANDSSLREELTAFPLAEDATEAIPAAQRPGLLSVLIHILWPKMRKRTGRLGGKGAPGSARSAILNFLSAAQPAELAPLIKLFLKPLSAAFRQPSNTPAESPALADKLFVEEWWVSHLGRESVGFWLESFDTDKLRKLPLGVKLGILNASSDLLQHLGFRIHLFLPEMSALLLALLETAPLQQAKSEDGQTKEGSREIRSSALRLLASIWARYPNSTNYNPLWKRFFAVTKPNLARLSTETSILQTKDLNMQKTYLRPAFVALIETLLAMLSLQHCNAAADRAPPLLEITASFAASPFLLPLLVDRPSQENAIDAESPIPQLLVQQEQPDWAPAGSELLGGVIAMLGAKSCAKPSREVALGMVESILEYGDHATEVTLQPHMGPLLDALRKVALSAAEKPSLGKRGKNAEPKGKGFAGKLTAMRALSILEKLLKLAMAAELADKLVDALLPMAVQKAMQRKASYKGEEGMLTRILNVLAAVWQQQAQQRAEGSQARLIEVAEALAPVAGRVESNAAGLALAAAYEALAQHAPALKPAAQILAGLMAVSQTEIDEVDYDARLAAFRSLSPAKWQEVVQAGGAAALAHRAFVDLRREDLASRHAAAQALERLLQAAAVPKNSLALPRDTGNVESFVLKLVLPNAKRSIDAASLAVRQEHLTLLRQIALRFPEKYPDLCVLADTDVEVDFFANIAHLQMHRRTRALQRLSKLVQEKLISPGTLLGVALPLLAQMIVEGRQAEGAGHELKAIDKDREANVTEFAIGVLKEVAASLSWPHYQQLLGRFLKAMQRQAEPGKAVVRAVCTVLDAFHFKLPHEVLDHAQESDAVEKEADTATRTEKGGDEATEAEAQQPDAGQAMLHSLSKRVLPALQSVMLEPSGEGVRPIVALAIVKLLRLLPPRIARAVLPKTLQGVANLLRSRLQGIRDNARNVLAAMTAELGPQYLDFVLDVLESALPATGYMGHVRGYTLQILLEALNKDMQPGSLDSAMPRILEAIEAQLFGVVSEEKEAGAFVKTKEAKRLRAYDTYQLLAQNILFREKLAELLAPVRERLGAADSPALRGKLTLLLEAAQRGIAANPSGTPQDVLIFVSGIMETVIPAEEAAVRRSAAAAEAASRGDGAAIEGEGDAATRHLHLLLAFALQLLHRGLKKGTLGKRSPEMLAMLDPLLQRLVDCLKSRHSAVVELALKIFTHLVQLPLPGLVTAAPGAGEGMTTLLERAPSTETRIAQECLKLLAGLLRACPEWAPTQRQLRFLVTWALSDIEAAASGSGAFTLLRGIIRRKLVLPEVYDVMNNVQDLMIRAQAKQTRELCSSTLLQFLLDYPIGDKRFRQHLNFLLTNLAFEHESGRLAAIDLLQILASKLPPDLLEANATVLFLPFVTRLSNDPSAECRRQVGRALQELFKAVSPAQCKVFAGHCATWLNGAEARLRRAALQTYNLLAEVEGENFGPRIRAQLPAITHLLTTHAPKDSDYEEEGGEYAEELAPSSRQAWQEAYYALLLLTRVLKLSPKELSWGRSEEVVALWRSVTRLLLHRHLWVQKLAADLLGMAFMDADIWPGLLQDHASRPPRLASLFFQQLEAPVAKEGNLAQAAKSLLFLAPHLAEADTAAGRIPTAEAAADLAAAMEGEGEEGHMPDADELETLERGLSLMGLIRRVSRLADDRTFLRQLTRKTALRWLAALATRLGSAGIAPFLPIIARPLFRITEGLSPNPEEVKVLAQEVVGHIREVAGADALIEAFSAARQSVTAVRAERKRREAVQAMLDPAAKARGKLQKQARRAAGRKRKMEEFIRVRSTGGRVKNRASRNQAK